MRKILAKYDKKNDICNNRTVYLYVFLFEAIKKAKKELLFLRFGD